MENLFLGIIIGALFMDFVAPLIQSLVNYVLLILQEKRDIIQYDIDIMENEIEYKSEKNPIGFSMGGEKNAKDNKI